MKVFLSLAPCKIFSFLLALARFFPTFNLLPPASLRNLVRLVFVTSPGSILQLIKAHTEIRLVARQLMEFQHQFPFPREYKHLHVFPFPFSFLKITKRRRKRNPVDVHNLICQSEWLKVDISTPSLKHTQTNTHRRLPTHQNGHQD